MLRLLSKETNIFSVPIYIGILLAVIFTTNVFSLSFLNVVFNLFAFGGFALGYILFNRIAINRHSHLPLFLYTIFILAFYKNGLDIGISIGLFTNSILLFFLTDDHPKLKENSYLLIGNLLAINYIFLPTTWPLTIFVLIHIISTSDKVFANIAKLFFGILLMFLGYLCLMYVLDFHSFDEDYLPLISQNIISDFSELYGLIPMAFFSLIAIVDHFIHFNEKSPRSKFKYSFILAFLLTQCIIIAFYMGNSYEYLLFIAFPVSIILSRFLRFIKRYWLKETIFWVIIISCLFSFKFNSFFTLLSV